jgi:hypothetical protein
VEEDGAPLERLTTSPNCASDVDEVSLIVVLLDADKSVSSDMDNGFNC